MPFTLTANTVFQPAWVDALRAELGDFHPLAAMQPTGEWQHYFEHYRLLPLLDVCRWSAGLACCEDTSLAVQYFVPKAGVRGCVVLVHGYMDHTGLYGHLLAYLVAQGWSVLCYDLPGHGVSAGEGHAIDSFSQYARQLHGLLEQVGPHLPAPWVAMGQSTGGAIILEHCRLYGDDHPVAGFQHRVLLAPLVRPAMYGLLRLQYGLLGRLLRQVPRRFSPNSHDPAFLTFLSREDPLQRPMIAVSWVGAMLRWIKQIEAAAPCDCAVTFIQGTADKTVDWQHNRKVLAELYPQLQEWLIQDARHHLVNEAIPWREQVFAAAGETLATVSPAPS